MWISDRERLVDLMSKPWASQFLNNHELLVFEIALSFRAHFFYHDPNDIQTSFFPNLLDIADENFFSVKIVAWGALLSANQS